MARRPEETKGALIFQEGKCIEGEFYIVAVYDDPASCTISFAAYELENDATYTYPLMYSEFDHLFRFDAELMNPSNQDGRYHWVIERLDFIVDQRGLKKLALATEPTPDVDQEVEEKPKPKLAMEPQVGGRIDAATRVKLLKELDTQDDAKLHVCLVKSENARKSFLADLHAKRALEQLKATQRLLKADEEREHRLAKLEIIRSEQEKRAQQQKATQDAMKSTKAQLETLMKQKEAQAIRRLIQDKDMQDRGMGREKDAARQKRKIAERSANEVKNIEKQRATQLARKREDQVVKRENVIKKRTKELVLRARSFNEQKAADEITLREKKDQIIEEIWAEKRKIYKEKEASMQRYEATDEVRERVSNAKDAKRAKDEYLALAAKRTEEAEKDEETLKRRRKIHDEALLQAKIDASARACAKREQARRNKEREKRIDIMIDTRMRKFREAQFLEQVRASTPHHGQSTGDAQIEAVNTSPSQSCQSFRRTSSRGANEMEEFQRTFEEMERKKRRDERIERRKLEDQKTEKVKQLGSKDPNAKEILRFQQWRREEDKRLKVLQEAQLSKELSAEEKARAAEEKVRAREETWEILEQVRREKSRDRAEERNKAVVHSIKSAPVGGGLPSVLAY